MRIIIIVTVKHYYRKSGHWLEFFWPGNMKGKVSILWERWSHQGGPSAEVSLCKQNHDTLLHKLKEQLYQSSFRHFMISVTVRFQILNGVCRIVCCWLECNLQTLKWQWMWWTLAWWTAMVTATCPSRPADSSASALLPSSGSWWRPVKTALRVPSFVPLLRRWRVSEENTTSQWFVWDSTS